MRHLWWKTWRETWLAVEIALPTALAICALLALWNETLPPASRMSPGIWQGVFWFVGLGLLILAAADSRRALGLDEAGAFLRTKPAATGQVARFAPYVAFMGLHVALLCVLFLLFALGMAALTVRGGFIRATRGVDLFTVPLFVWLTAWAAVVGATLAPRGRPAGMWIATGIGAFYSACAYVSLASFGGDDAGWLSIASQNRGLWVLAAVGVALPALAFVLSVRPQPTVQRIGRGALIAVLAGSVLGLMADSYERVSPREAVERTVETLRSEGFVAGIVERQEQYERLHAHRNEAQARAARAEATRLGLAHPDEAVRDLFALLKPAADPSRALAAIRRDPALLQYVHPGAIGWPRDSADDPAMFALIDLVRPRDRSRPLRRAFTWSLWGMLRNAPAPERRAALVNHIAAWPEWADGGVPSIVLERRELAYALRGAIPTPEWVREKAWRITDPDARAAVLLRMTAFELDAELRADLADTLATMPGLGRVDFSVMESYLSGSELRAALARRWEALPNERGFTFHWAVQDAPKLALRWLLASPDEPAIQWQLARHGSELGVGDPTPMAERPAALLARLVRLAGPERVVGPQVAAMQAPEVVRVDWEGLRSLVEALGTTESHRLRQEYAKALEQLTGQDFGWDMKRWPAWLREHGPTGRAA